MLAPGALGTAGRALSRALSLSHGLGTVVVERWWQVPLAKEGRRPRLYRRHRIYRLLQDSKHQPRGNMELLLTQPVEGEHFSREFR
ncbi:39S ribosomal protein L9, mitochondrial-like, partial [Neopelma chrysocephalum]|uniref:39S ribosomal protein L9, mitochondrial-like n=1 Tax=Neopelma chrysocephalum TaxID=114329 RepID=UPI000FCCF983